MEEPHGDIGPVIVSYQDHRRDPEDVSQDGYGESDDEKDRPLVKRAHKQVSINCCQG